MTAMLRYVRRLRNELRTNTGAAEIDDDALACLIQSQRGVNSRTRLFQPIKFDGGVSVFSPRTPCWPRRGIPLVEKSSQTYS